MIKAEQIVEGVRRLAAEHPDAVYVKPSGINRCGCLFGQALRKFEGVEVSDLESKLGIASLLRKRLGIPVDHDQAEWLITAQTAQDLGRSWAKAIQKADAELE